MVLCICVATAYGCGRSNAPPPNSAGQSQPTPGPSTGSGPTYGPTAGPAPAPIPRAKYYEFNDVPIPQEMNVQSKNSYVFQSGQIKMGFLTLRGRVDSNSLVSFFVSALPHDGWRLKGQFKFNRSLLIFDKPDKVCVILMKEATYYTYVEVYVSPVTGS